MKSRNINGLKELSVSELQERLKGEELRLAKLKINHAVSSLENPNVIKEARRSIARIHTELRSRQ